MNYASVVFAGFSTIAAIWYAVSARKHFNGPTVVQIHRRQSMSPEVHTSALPEH